MNLLTVQPRLISLGHLWKLVKTLQDLDASPHLVMVSTCYVAGNRKGRAPEKPLSQSPFYVPLNWRGKKQKPLGELALI